MVVSSSTPPPVQDAIEIVDKAWFNHKRDTFVLYEPSLEYCHDWAFRTQLSQGASGTRYNLFDEWKESLRASNRIAFSALGAYERLGLEHSPISLITPDNEDGSRRYYIARDSNLGASRSDIIENGLFGLFGEKKAILVDLPDTETFKTLYRISKSHVTSY